MKTKSKWIMNGAAAGALMLTLGAPAFAQSRGDWNRNDSNRNESDRSGNYDRRDDQRNDQRNDQRDVQRNDQRDNQRSDYRENQRVTLSGQVSSFTHERDGYRVRLDRGGDFWVPERSFGSRLRDLRSGVSISLGGIFRGGTIYVDAVNWPNARDGYYAYHDGFVRGVVSRVDYRRGTVWVREERSGRLIAAQLPYRRDVRRGEFVELRAR